MTLPLGVAECLMASKACQSDYRSLLVSIAALWHALARHDEAMHALLVSWGAAVSAKPDMCWPFDRLIRGGSRCSCAAVISWLVVCGPSGLR
jgi:hypothetical protein